MADERSDEAATLPALLDTQEVVGRITAALLHAPVEGLDAAVDDGLARLGRHLRVDRTYVFLFHDELMTNTHEWCAAGVRPEIDNLQGIEAAEIGAWMGPMAAGEAVEVADVAALPEARRAERELLQPQGITSLLAVPMLALGELVGFIGFDAVTAHRRFTAHEAALLRGVADVVCVALVQRRRVDEARRADERLAALTRHGTDLVLVFDADGRPSYRSDSWQRKIGAPAGTGGSWYGALHPDDVAHVRARVEFLGQRLGGQGVAATGDIRVAGGDGRWVWLTGTLSDLRHHDAVRGIVLNAHDVTERKVMEEQLARDALEDPLTGLGNRLMLTMFLRHACDRLGAMEGGVGVIFLDVDRFKMVNDTHGHARGDQVLQSVAARLAEHVHPSDTLARLGGDEFVVLTERFTDRALVEAFARDLHQALSTEVLAGGQPFRLTASVGVAVGRGPGVDADRLLADADTAMYRAKRSGRDTVVVFDEGMRADVVRASSVLDRLPAALRDGLVEVHYQPVFDLRSGQVIGAEALARWSDAQLGRVPPQEFVGLAEEAGLITLLTGAVMDKVVADLSRWPTDLTVSVNLSRRMLADPGTATWLSQRLAAGGIDPHRLCVEVTETALMQDPQMAQQVIAEIRALGVRTAIDDFGTGYSSLSALRELPIDLLKVDRTFVQGIATDPRDRRLVGAMVSLAHDLGMQACGEGIETEAQREALLAEGCALGQGFLFHPALPPAAFADLVA